jgi:hypothetical protein
LPRGRRREECRQAVAGSNIGDAINLLLNIQVDTLRCDETSLDRVIVAQSALNAERVVTE